VRPDSPVVTLSQAAPELIDMRLVELPELLPVVRQLAAYDPGWAQARVAQQQSRGATDRERSREPQVWLHREPVVLPRGPGHVCRHGQGRYRDDHAADGGDGARVHLNLQARQAARSRTGILSDLSSRVTTTEANSGHYGPPGEARVRS
jgi:hypothetical protein